VFTETPLHVAASLGSAACTKLLLDAGADVRAALGAGKATALHLAAEDGHAESTLAQSVEVVELLVGKRADVRARDSDGRTPLHGAIVRGARAYYGGDVTLRTNGGVSALSFIVRRVPDVVPRYLCKLDDAVHVSEHELGDVDCELTIDFRPLGRGGATSSFCGGITYFNVTLRINGGVSALSFIVRRVPDVVPRYLCKLDDAVHVSEHELGDVDCELTIDFRPLSARRGAAVPLQAGRRGARVSALSFIVRRVPDVVPRYLCKLDDAVHVSEHELGDVDCELTIDFRPLVGRKDILKHPVAETFLFLKWRRIRKFFVLSFIYHALFISLYSLFILHILMRRGDVQRTLIPAASTISDPAAQSVLLAEGDLPSVSRLVRLHSTIPNWDIDNGVIRTNTSDWQHDIAAITIFFCWLELMMIIGRFPTFGLYVQMFTTVTVNFATFLLAYSCILIAFGLAFSVLFSNYPAFHLPAGLVKTVMMMSGELEYEDIFYNNCTDSQTHYPFTAHGMFLIFVLLVTVILTNLLVGLAVSDIQALQESAGLDRLVRQTQLVAHLESMLFSSLLTCAPKQLLAVLRWGALLTASHMRTLNVRPNDPRENRIPKDLIMSIYKMVASKKNTKRSIRKNSNYEFRLRRSKDEEDRDRHVKRKSNLYDRYSFESQQVERRKRTTSNSATDPLNYTNSFSINAIQEICMVDIKNQLIELNKKVNKLLEAGAKQGDAVIL
ncbi:Transient receptor potential ion channel, partial [Operophtera brumata]